MVWHEGNGKDRAKVVRAFKDLGQGLRVEELAAATGLSEAAVLAVLRHVPEHLRMSDFYDRGAQGWFYDPYVDLYGRVLSIF